MIAHQQVIRYENLVNLQRQHSRAILARNCAASIYCLALNGSNTLQGAKGNVREPLGHDHSGQLSIMGLSDDNYRRSEFTIGEDMFPPGVPMPPTRTLPAQFECQICFEVNKYQKPSGWTKHVHEDIQPFICTFSECKEPKSFKWKSSWLRHENEFHRALEWWVCQFEDCRYPCYRKDNFLQHLAYIDRCYHETAHKSQEEPCKFCGKTFNTWKQLSIHLAKHMEQIFLPILRIISELPYDANNSLRDMFDKATDTASQSGGNGLPTEMIPTQVSPSITNLDHEQFLRPEGEDEEAWELQSIASLNTFRDSALGSSLPSGISISTVQGLPRSAQEEVFVILSSDTELQFLFEEAARRMSKPRFVRNIRRLFLRFHGDLQNSAVDPREKDAASIVERHAQCLYDLELLGKEIDAFQIPRKFIYHDETPRGLTPRATYPWIFSQNFSGDGNERLYLSTTIDMLTDLWGPSWQIISNSEPDRIQQYDIGNGAIIPWMSSVRGDGRAPSVHSSEVFCHWTSFKDWGGTEVEVQPNQSPSSRKYFLPSDTLLIGASQEFGLHVNQGCISSTERLSTIKTHLDQQGALRSLKTFRPRRYANSHAVQVQGSAMGIISAAGTVTYKHRNGNTMKDALMERWRHDLRNPVDLEAFSGVEVSLCTGNARRRRLLHLLGSPNMRNYLRGISFRWVSEACEHAYFRALRCPRSFRKFWKGSSEYQDNVGDAITKCLDALEETGIDRDSRELRALWVESFNVEGESDGESEDESEIYVNPEATSLLAPITTPLTVSSFFEEWIVTLFRSEHTWTGFLEDSEESLTMAIVGTTCLDFDYKGYGRRCSKARPYLANQIQIQGVSLCFKPL
ncbi:hypothetical protein B0O99DRAFT_594027 [Bisporella sp. PMI_857]|nr:hypothetical protein B0O99DRAFT_594027 [Bisporella sp. PMI_857]